VPALSSTAKLTSLRSSLLGIDPTPRRRVCVQSLIFA